MILGSIDCFKEITNTFMFLIAEFYELKNNDSEEFYNKQFCNARLDKHDDQTSIGIMRTQLRALLKPFGPAQQNCIEGFRGFLISRHVVSDFAWGGSKCPPQAKSKFLNVFFIEFLNV